MLTIILLTLQLLTISVSSKEADYATACDALLFAKTVKHFGKKACKGGFTFEQKQAELSRLVSAITPNPAISVSNVGQDLLHLDLIFRYATFCGLSNCKTREQVSGFSDYTDPVSQKKFFTGKYSVESYRHVDGYKENRENMQADFSLKRFRLSDMQRDARFNGGSGNCTLPLFERGFYARKGFIDSLPETALTQIQSDLDLVISKNPEYSLIVTGHSLGGALASLFAAHWKIKGKNLNALYTYAQPIVGSLNMNNWLARCIGVERYIRVTGSNDLVPRGSYYNSPDPATTMSHPDDVVEVYFPHHDSPHDHRICKGGRDPQCLLGVSCKDLSWEHHSDLGGLGIRANLRLISEGPGSRLEPTDCRRVLEGARSNAQGLFQKTENSIRKVSQRISDFITQ